MKVSLSKIFHRIIRSRMFKQAVANGIIALLKEWAQYRDNGLTETRVSEVREWFKDPRGEGK